MKRHLRISGKHHNQLFEHLFPGDGKEAVALALCGHHINSDLRTILTVHEVFCIAHEKCTRSPDYVRWSPTTEEVIGIFDTGREKGFSVLKIHSHPRGNGRFSELDDEADSQLFPSIYGWIGGNHPHASAILLPDGKLVARIVTSDATFIAFDRVLVAGDAIKLWTSKDRVRTHRSSLVRKRQFLKGMKVGVVGASGTGSPTIEQLARLGVGELLIIDPDIVEEKNLNRILNTTIDHARRKCYKVDVLSSSIKAIGGNTNVTALRKNIYDLTGIAIWELISCDVIFGCVDSFDGRELLNMISTYYLIPYFDLGVRVVAGGVGEMDSINGVFHYIQPGGSSLKSRGAYSGEDLMNADFERENPNSTEKERKEKYIQGVGEQVENPIVISLNMQVSSFAVNEFLWRLDYCLDKKELLEDRRWKYLSISGGEICSCPDGKADSFLEKYVGRGDDSPLLGLGGRLGSLTPPARAKGPFNWKIITWLGTLAQRSGSLRLLHL